MNTIVETLIKLKSRCDLESDIGKEYSLAPREVCLLLRLEPDKEYSGHDIAGMLELSPSRVSRIIHKLVSKSILVSRIDETDRRYSVVHFSAAGKELRRNIKVNQNTCEQRILDKLGPDETAKVQEGLSLLLGAL